MLNKVQIIGRLGADPELKYTQSGMAVTSLNVATNEGYTDKDGNKVDHTEWHKISVFNRMAETCAQYIGKGSLVYAEGKLQTRKWQDKDGNDRYTTEIRADRVKFLDRKGEYEAGRAQGKKPNRGNASRDEDYGSPFPSEASDMDSTPF